MACEQAHTALSESLQSVLVLECGLGLAKGKHLSIACLFFERTLSALPVCIYLHQFSN